MPTVAEVPEHSVQELSSDDNSIAATVILGSDSEERTVIISSGPDLSHGVTQRLSEDAPSHSIERLLKSTYSPTSSEPSHASETPSRRTIRKSPLHSTSESVDCAVGGNGLGTPVSSVGTPVVVQPRHLSYESGIKYEGVGEGSDSTVISIYDSLLSLQSHRPGRSELKTVDLSTFPHEKLNYLPTKYNGDIIFELPPLPTMKGGGAAMLEGMDRRRDGHAWIETATTNITDPDGQLSFRYVKCLGHLRCNNIGCPHLERCGEYNEKYWEGSTPDLLIPGPVTEVPQKCTILCRICKSIPSCLKLCPCKMFYITSKNPLMSRACVHFGSHDHSVATGDCREAMDIIREKVRDQVAKTPHAKSSAISLVVGRELLMKGLVDENGDGKKLSEDDFAQVLDKWSALSTPHVNNMIKDARVLCGQGGYIDNILKLKKASTYDYIHDSRFPGQGGGSNIVYLFKMSTVGAGSDVRRMQLGGDLQFAWIMFDHVKRVVGWTSLGAHVYDLVYCKVMTICVCDMMCEMADAQEQMWVSMLALLRQHGLEDVNFKGFMADNA